MLVQELTTRWRRFVVVSLARPSVLTLSQWPLLSWGRWQGDVAGGEERCRCFLQSLEAGGGGGGGGGGCRCFQRNAACSTCVFVPCAKHVTAPSVAVVCKHGKCASSLEIEVGFVPRFLSRPSCYFRFPAKSRLLCRRHWTKPSSGATIGPGFVFGWVNVRLKISVFSSFFLSFSSSPCEPVWPSGKALCCKQKDLGTSRVGFFLLFFLLHFQKLYNNDNKDDF